MICPLLYALAFQPSDPIWFQVPTPMNLSCYDVVKRQCVDLIGDISQFTTSNWCAWQNTTVLCPAIRLPPPANPAVEFEVWSTPRDMSNGYFRMANSTDTLAICVAKIVTATIDPDTCECEYLADDVLSFQVLFDRVTVKSPCAEAASPFGEPRE